MSHGDARSFLDRIDQDVRFRQAAITAPDGKSVTIVHSLIEFGSAHGLTFTAAELIAALDERREPISERELGGSQLEAVAGGIGIGEDALNTVGDDAQLANVDMQNWMQKVQQYLQMASNVSRSSHDNAMNTIRKMKG